jgi:hypothetical protein
MDVILASAAVTEDRMAYHYAMAEPGLEGGWFLMFPECAGFSFAQPAEQIIEHAQDWLATAAMNRHGLPAAIEDGAFPPTDLSDFAPLAVVVVIPFAETGQRKAA